MPSFSLSSPPSLAELQETLQQFLRFAPVPYLGPIDRDFGPGTRAAFESIAAGIVSVTRPDIPAPEPPPAPRIDYAALGLQHNNWPLEHEAEAFFGYPANLTQIDVDYPLHLFSGNGQLVTRITCNVKVAASLRRIFAAIHAYYGTPEAIHATGVDVFDGVYNDRPIRGQSSGHSMHAFGAAIDIDAEHNVLGATHGRMPAAVVSIFRAEGWRWGGDYIGRKDWMHFEACV